MKLSFFEFSIRILTVALLVAATTAPAAQQKPPKKVAVEITEIETTFDEGGIRFEGSVTGWRKKPIPGLVMQLEFFDSTGALLNILNQTIEEEATKSSFISSATRSPERSAFGWLCSAAGAGN